MRGPTPSLLLVAIALLLLPVVAWAGPVDRVDRLLADERFDDAAAAARKWLERNPEAAEAEEMRVRLAEAAFHGVLASPSLARTAAWREEFGDTARRADLDSLEANLRLYSAAEAGTEAAYLAVADAWAGTAAAREALSRAEELAFQAAKTDGSAEALSAFLGAYDELSHADAALELWRAAAWVQAEEVDTAQIWQDLRMQDPEHPRAAEAILHEQTRALEELGPEAEASALMRLARRYADGPAGWQALRRATEAATLRAVGPDGATLLEISLGPPGSQEGPPIAFGAVARIELLHEGRLPRAGVVEISVHAVIEDRPVSWQRATFRQSARWGVRGDPAGPQAPSGGAFATDKPLCRGDLLERVEIRVVLRLGSESETWTRTATPEHPCGGPLPWALRREDGRAQRLRRGDQEQALGGGLLGQEWPCDGPMLVDSHGVSAVCGGWALQGFGHGTLVRRPPSRPPAFEDPESPWLDALPGEGWRALDVPDGWHYGGGPSCGLRSRPGDLVDEADAAPDSTPALDAAAAPDSTPALDAAAAPDSTPALDAAAAPDSTPAPDAAALVVEALGAGGATDPVNPPSPAGPVAPAPPAAPPALPWLPEGSEEWVRDVDGDGVADRVAAWGAPGAGHLVLGGGPLPPGTAWVIPWPRGVDPSRSLLNRGGCSLDWAPAP